MTDQPRTKITYATLRADNAELHAAFEEALVAARARLGGGHPNVIGGKERSGAGESELRSPIDSDILVGRFANATRQDVGDAIAAARAAQPAWNALGWEKRVDDHDRRGRPHQRAAHGVRRADGHRGGQEPPGGIG